MKLEVMQSPIKYSHKLDVSYHVTENINPDLAEFIKVKAFALTVDNEIPELDIGTTINENTPFIEFIFHRMIIQEDSTLSLLDIADMYSAQLYNIVSPLVNQISQEFISNIFNIESSFDITHFTFLEKTKISKNFPINCISAATSKAFSVLTKGIPAKHIAGGLFKKDTFYLEDNIEVEDIVISNIIRDLNLFELSPSISGLPRNTNTSYVFSGTFFNSKLDLTPHYNEYLKYDETTKV